MTGDEFVELLKEQVEFKPLFDLLNHHYPNLKNHVRLLGREGVHLYVIGKEDDIIDNMEGARLMTARGPRSGLVSEQRLYVCKCTKSIQ